MVQVMKHEWHQVDSQFLAEIDEVILAEIYPDLDEHEIAQLMRDIETGNYSIEDVMNDAWDNNIDIEWDKDYDDWWTDRKGGYDITYELVDKPTEETEEQFPPMDKGEWEKAIDELQAEVEYMQELQNFKDNEDIHQEIRDAFIEIINGEGL